MIKLVLQYGRSVGRPFAYIKLADGTSRVELSHVWKAGKLTDVVAELRRVADEIERTL